MIIRVKQISVAELQALASNGRSPESRWLANRELKLRGYAA